MRGNQSNGESSKRKGRSWATDKASHAAEIESKRNKSRTRDASDAAAGLILLCNELSANEQRIVRGLSLVCPENGSSDFGINEQRNPNFGSLGKKSESPASVINPWQWETRAEQEVSSHAQSIFASGQPSSVNADPSSQAPYVQLAENGRENSGWNARIVLDLMKAPHRRPPRLCSDGSRSSNDSGRNEVALSGESKDAVAAMELLEMKEEHLTDQRLIAELAQVALPLPDE
mmetsp:Transcript_55117/g.112729  ORF Transcript_55117/g.112729 Transcript_55117/m.112729 type:complete len:232 (-) Transcript_55117:234-929(-)|eukprot:CAMPEP_0181323242 /NCGR_PEP_ID=MMETSP1101-20121128/19671_1 /TAXON_ID=46948 /ORGANISM="Rhodomonas abbreviata, Strain Caron Lab Isolate" /LENGTH=231 /DNA_ID=CAMNT_0023431237 /DNA_START=171 /DNA_END=866 /DNA_ORIENTATION=-